ncbi:hypothetical protein VE04_02928 [Pseudogymnoascus sp. 24MN13]|nr:hypothetical protein VE04_02928 [Pseudogymnoascus sp. 24MN13]
MDDDDVQETPVASGGEQTTAPAGQPAAGSTTEQAPAKPPRPLSAQQQAENTLKEAFPGVEAAVIKAVLIASGGKIEPAFNALLGMTDPEAAAQAAAIAEQAPPQPPRPARAGPELTQLEADELYARQLAEHFDSTQDRNRNRGGPQRGPNQRSGSYHEEDEYSFMDDDLPVIKENLRKGFIETQSKVNGWFTNLKKRVDGVDLGGSPEAQQRQERGYNQGFQNQQYNSRRGDTGRRSGDSGRYDADPQVLSDDFTGIQLNDDTSNARRSTRPLANPDLFKPPPATPRSNDGSRKVSFQDGPPEEIDVYGGPPGRAAKDAAATTPASGKQSKWQPLSSVDPNPVGEGDNDPFSLGDSEDEKEVKAGGKEGKDEVKKVGGAAEGSEVKSETAEAGKNEKKEGAKDA